MRKKRVVSGFCLIGILFFQCSSFFASVNAAGEGVAVSQITSWYMGKITDPAFTTIPHDSNFGKTFGNDNYRWALPTAQSISLLKKKYGVTTIVSLISSKEMGKSVVNAIQKSGLTRIHIPLTNRPPKKADRAKILPALKNGHTFVHCTYGADRTGAIIARARVELMGVSPDTAYQDMLTYNPKVGKKNAYQKAFAYFKAFIYHGLAS